MSKYWPGSRTSIASQADAYTLSGESVGYGKLRDLFGQKIPAKK
jgi:hypothetical protein